MEPKINSETFHQEIAHLEAQLAAKKQEFMKSGEHLPEKQVFKEVVREHAFAGEGVASATPSAGTTTAAPARTTTQEDEEQINTLIAQAFTKGIASAVAEARKIGDPYLIDMLHDRLADEYYQKLLAARKIKS